MNKNKNVPPPDTHEAIITPTHLAEMLPMYRAIVQHEGDTASAPTLQASYMVALMEWAIGEYERAQALQGEIDDGARYAAMTLNHNGGGANG